MSSEFCLQLIWAEITKKGTWKTVSWEEECEILDLGMHLLAVLDTNIKIKYVSEKKRKKKKSQFSTL